MKTYDLIAFARKLAAVESWTTLDEDDVRWCLTELARQLEDTSGIKAIKQFEQDLEKAMSKRKTDES